ncbi:hypothetical protein [Priestia megaterium]|uniref:hypothetical protein n=1 Tax=Priestia megaterium TaxID=1404 RepID=UPI003459EBE5
MKGLREQVEKTQKDLTEKLSQLNEEVNHQFMLINKTLDKLEGSNKDVEQSDEVTIKVQEAIIERLKKGVLTSDDVINIMDNYLEKGERFNLLDKLYERHYNLNPQSLNITD